MTSSYSSFSHLIIVTTPGLAGGRVVASNLSRRCNVKLKYLLNDPSSICINCFHTRLGFKFLDYMFSFFKLSSYIFRFKKINILAEGIIPALFVSVIKNIFFYKDIRLVSRIGRYWNDHELKFLWFFIFISSNKIITPLKANLSHAALSKWHHKISYVPNPLDIEFHAYTNEVTNRNSYLIIGRAIPQKRLELAILFAYRLSKLSSANLVLFLDGNSEYYKKIKRLALDKGFTVYPYVNDLVPFYRNAIVLINFSHSEGFSMVSYEAAVFGVPTISLQGISGQNEMISDTGYGVILNSENDLCEANEFLRNFIYTPKSFDWDFCSNYF